MMDQDADFSFTNKMATKERVSGMFSTLAELGTLFTTGSVAMGTAAGIVGGHVGSGFYDASAALGKSMRYKTAKRGGSAPDSFRKMPKRKSYASRMYDNQVKRQRTGGRRRRIAKKRMANKNNKRYKKLQTRAKKVIKGVVQKTLECDIPVGSYHKDYVMDMDWNQTTANLQLLYTNGQRFGVNSGVYTAEALEFAPFKVQKMLDAVAVVYNGKAKAMNYEATTNNFPDPKRLKVSFTYCSYELKMTNITPYRFEVKLYRAKAKMDCNVTVTNTWDTALNSLPWRQETAGEPNPNHINIGTGGLKPLSKMWDITTQSFWLEPGQTKTFRTVFKGCVDFNKHYIVTGETASLASYANGVSQSWAFVAKPGPSIYGATTEAAQTMGLVGMTSSNSLQKAIVCEAREIYKFMQPPNTEDEHEGNGIVYLRDYPAYDDTKDWKFVYNERKNLITNQTQI